MWNPVDLEKSYQEFMQNLGEWAHDGVEDVNLAMLQECSILESLNDEDDGADDLTQYFHVIESLDKVTLFNEQFAVWIVPKMDRDIPLTYVLIALNQEEKPHLEVVFTTKGVYNTPKFVLKVLQHYLVDMLETEAEINFLRKSQ